MFVAGTKDVSMDNTNLHASQAADDRKAAGFLRSCFTDRKLEQALLPSLDLYDAPNPLLPPGWEQRLDEKSGRVFFVDHNTCA